MSVEETPEANHVLKIDAGMPELSMTGTTGQASLRALMPMTLNINWAMKCIFALVTVFAIIASWLSGQRSGFELHAMNFTNGPAVTVKNDGRSDQVLKLCVDSGDEIRGKFLDNRAWDVVPRPKEWKVVKSKWVLRFYQNQDGSIEQVKARLVACGYSQVAGQDCTKVFAVTLSASNFRLFCF